jgi:RES domain-containing protein
VASWTSEPRALADTWIVYRHTAPGIPPLWYGAGSTTLRQEAGRWHREGESIAQYLALSSDGAWAERVRYESIRTDERRREDRRCLWQLLVMEERIADLSSFDAWAACGLDPSIAVGRHDESRALASELRSAGFRGVLSPSAALDRPGALNLTLFRERIEHRIAGGPLPSQPIVPSGLWLPTILITDSGTPTQYALEHTCYRAGAHRTLAEWRGMRAPRG